MDCALGNEARIQRCPYTSDGEHPQFSRIPRSGYDPGPLKGFFCRLIIGRFFALSALRLM